MRRKILIILSLFGLNVLIFCFLAIGNSWGGWDEKLKLPSSDSEVPPKASEYEFLETNLQEQQQKNFYQNEASLIRKGELFKKWLHDANLSNVIEFEKIEYREKFTLQERTHPKKNFLRIYNLYLRTTDTCTFYKAIHDEMIMPENLFFKFIHLLGIPPEFAKLTIKDTELEIIFFLVANKDGELYTFSSVRLFRDLCNPLPGGVKGVGGIIENIFIGEELNDKKLIEKIKKIGNSKEIILKDMSTDVDKKIENSRGLNDSKEPQLLAAPEMITNFFKEYASKRGGKVQVTASTPRFINVYIKNLRNEVIPQSNYWENLQLSLFLFYKDKGFVDIGCVLDGQYAGGLGKLFPAEESFSDMEPQYAKQLQAYMGELLVNLQKYLATGDF